MASAGENLNGSQFYITLRERIDYLNEQKTVFGQITEGLEVLDKFNHVLLIYYSYILMMKEDH